MHIILGLITPCLICIVGCSGTPRIAPEDQLNRYTDEPYARVLAAAVRGGLVDYGVVATHEDDLNVYLDACGAWDRCASCRDG